MSTPLVDAELTRLHRESDQLNEAIRHAIEAKCKQARYLQAFYMVAPTEWLQRVVEAFPTWQSPWLGLCISAVTQPDGKVQVPIAYGLAHICLRTVDHAGPCGWFEPMMACTAAHRGPHVIADGDKMTWHDHDRRWLELLDDLNGWGEFGTVDAGVARAQSITDTLEGWRRQDREATRAAIEAELIDNAKEYFTENGRSILSARVQGIW